MTGVSVFKTFRGPAQLALEAPVLLPSAACGSLLRYLFPFFFYHTFCGTSNRSWASHACNVIIHSYTPTIIHSYTPTSEMWQLRGYLQK